MRHVGPGRPASPAPARPAGGRPLRPALPSVLRSRSSPRNRAARPPWPRRATAVRVVADDEVGGTRHCAGAARATAWSRVARLIDAAATQVSNTAGEMPGLAGVKCSSTSSAACGVEESGTVGPEAMTSSGSPSTSEMISVTSRPARHARSNPPPLMRLSCLRTVLSCSMLAPAALRWRVTASLSASVMPSTGAGIRAEPPPEIRHRQRSSGPSDSTSRRISSAPATPSGVGSLTPAGRAACKWMRCKGRTQSAGTLTQPVSCFSGHQLRAEHVLRPLRPCPPPPCRPRPRRYGGWRPAESRQGRSRAIRPFHAEVLPHQSRRANRLDARLPDLQSVLARGLPVKEAYWESWVSPLCLTPVK